MKPAFLRRSRAQPSRKGTVGTASADASSSMESQSKQLGDSAGFSVHGSS
jgi:hypothetical protein